MENTRPEVLTFAVLGNILNFAYNIPLVFQVYKNSSTKNISGLFLILRFCGSISWLIYAILVSDVWVGCSYTVTFIATFMIGLVKCKDRRQKQIGITSNSEVLSPRNEIATGVLELRNNGRS